MWALDHKEIWIPKSLCFWTMVLEKTLQNSLDYQIHVDNPFQEVELNFPTFECELDLVTYFQDYCMERGNGTFTVEKPGKNFLLINTISPWKAIFLRVLPHITYNLECLNRVKFLFLAMLSRPYLCLLHNRCLFSLSLWSDTTSIWTEKDPVELLDMKVFLCPFLICKK